MTEKACLTRERLEQVFPLISAVFRFRPAISHVQFLAGIVCNFQIFRLLCVWHFRNLVEIGDGRLFLQIAFCFMLKVRDRAPSPVADFRF